MIDKMNKSLEKANNLLETTNTFMNNLNNAGVSVENLARIYTDCKRINAQAEAIKDWSNVEITKTISKYKLCQEFMYHAFGQREFALKKHYNLLDKAVEEDNKDLIIEALKGISSIVTTSPLEDLEKFAQIFNDTSKPLLDF